MTMSGTDHGNGLQRADRSKPTPAPQLSPLGRALLDLIPDAYESASMPVLCERVAKVEREILNLIPLVNHTAPMRDPS